MNTSYNTLEVRQTDWTDRHRKLWTNTHWKLWSQWTYRQENVDRQTGKCGQTDRKMWTDRQWRQQRCNRIALQPFISSCQLTYTGHIIYIYIYITVNALQVFDLHVGPLSKLLGQLWLCGKGMCVCIGISIDSLSLQHWGAYMVVLVCVCMCTGIHMSRVTTGAHMHLWIIPMHPCACHHQSDTRWEGRLPDAHLELWLQNILMLTSWTHVNAYIRLYK